MSAYIKNRQWSDCMIPQIKSIVGPLLLEPAPFERDAKEATDLIVLKAKDMRIAARVRRPGYAERYPFQFTIRAHLGSGVKTEFAKIAEGWGDWLFYGHADGADKIGLWWLIDLSAFRYALIMGGRDGMKDVSWQDCRNGDGTGFYAFDVRDFPASPPILISSSRPIQMRAAA